MRGILFGAVCLALTVGPASAAEVPPPDHQPCFPGAYYRKAVSSQDVWTGIETIVRLPTPHYDMDRLHPDTNRPLDNSSIYLGGNAGGQESDAGVNWEIIRRPDGTISQQRVAFRPFWRVTAWNSGPAQAEYYYQPGDVLRMAVYTEETDRMTMEIEVLERTGESLEFVQNLGVEDAFATLTVTFDAPGYGPGRVQEWKRVNGLDQFGGEGTEVEPTKTRIENAEWLEAWLLRGDEGRFAFTSERYTDMRCPDPAHVTVIGTENAAKGGEIVHLHGEAVEPADLQGNGIAVE